MIQRRKNAKIVSLQAFVVNAVPQRQSASNANQVSTVMLAQISRARLAFLLASLV